MYQSNTKDNSVFADKDQAFIVTLTLWFMPIFDKDKFKNYKSYNDFPLSLFLLALPYLKIVMPM